MTMQSKLASFSGFRSLLVIGTLLVGGYAHAAGWSQLSEAQREVLVEYESQWLDLSSERPGPTRPGCTTLVGHGSR